MNMTRYNYYENNLLLCYFQFISRRDTEGMSSRRRSAHRYKFVFSLGINRVIPKKVWDYLFLSIKANISRSPRTHFPE